MSLLYKSVNILYLRLYPESMRHFTSLRVAFQVRGSLKKIDFIYFAASISPK